MSVLTDKLILNGIENGEHKSNNASLLSEVNDIDRLRSASQAQMSGGYTISCGNSNRGNRISEDSSIVRDGFKRCCLQFWTGMFMMLFLISFLFDAVLKKPAYDYIADVTAIISQMIIVILCKIFIDEVYRKHLPLELVPTKLQNSPLVRHRLTQNQGSVGRSYGDKTFCQVSWIILNDININIHTFSAGMCFAYYLSTSMCMIQAIYNNKSNMSLYVRIMIRYLVNAISIPIPAILLQQFYKFANFDYENANEDVSHLSKKVAHKFGILSGSIFQTLLFAQYLFILASIVSKYAIDYDDYEQLIKDMYNCPQNGLFICVYTYLYIINHKYRMYPNTRIYNE